MWMIRLGREQVALNRSGGDQRESVKEGEAVAGIGRSSCKLPPGEAI
jgi:hypothetical protein